MQHKKITTQMRDVIKEEKRKKSVTEEKALQSNE